MASPRWLHRAFHPQNDAGACGICEAPLVQDGPLVFFAAFRRDASDAPIFSGASQLETRGYAAGQTTARPAGCTCSNKMLHSRGSRSKAQCALYVACDCRTRNARVHKRWCAQRIIFVAAPGVYSGMCHVDCVSTAGGATPMDPGGPGQLASRRVLPGTRHVGVENSLVTGPVVVQRAVPSWPPAPVAAPVMVPAVAPVAPAAPACEDCGSTATPCDCPGVLRFANLRLDDDEPEADDADDDDDAGVQRFRLLDLD